MAYKNTIKRKTRRTKTRRTKRLRRRSGGVGPICASHAQNNDCTRYSNNCNKYAYSGKDGQLYTCRHPVNKSKSCQPVSAVLRSKKLCPVQQINSSPRPISPRPLSSRQLSRPSKLTLPTNRIENQPIERQSTPIPSRDSREKYTLNKAATFNRQQNLRSTRKKKQGRKKSPLPTWVPPKREAIPYQQEEPIPGQINFDAY